MTAESGVPSMGFLVWHLSLRWQAQLSYELHPLAVTPPEYAFLAHLYGLSQAGAKPSQRELAAVSGLDPMYISKLARRLESARLVRRAPHSADPRAIQLSLTSSGVDVVTKARRIASKLDRQRLAVLGGMTSEQATQLKAWLRTLLGQAQEANRAHAASSTTRPPNRREQRR